MYSVLFRRPAADFLNSLPEKSKKIISDKLTILKTSPYPGSGGDKERLHTSELEVFRLHIGRCFTALYIIIPILTKPGLRLLI